MPSSSQWSSRLRSYIFFDPLIWLYTVVLGTLSLLSSLFDRDGSIQHGFARLWSRMILGTIGSPVTVTGMDRVDAARPHLYAVNHISAMDIPVLYAHLPFPFRIIAKKELFSYPFLGWHLRRSGQIPIDPDHAIASMRSLNRATRTLREHGLPLVVFPEGGRSDDGRIQPFMPGAFYVAIKAQVEVVPMALIGTFEMLPMNTYHIRPRPLELLVGEPIATTGYSTREMEKLAVVVQKAIEDLYYSKSVLPDPRAQSARTVTAAEGA